MKGIVFYLGNSTVDEDRSILILKGYVLNINNERTMYSYVILPLCQALYQHIVCISLILMTI